MMAMESTRLDDEGSVVYVGTDCMYKYNNISLSIPKLLQFLFSVDLVGWPSRLTHEHLTTH